MAAKEAHQAHSEQHVSPTKRRSKRKMSSSSSSDSSPSPPVRKSPVKCSGSREKQTHEMNVSSLINEAFSKLQNDLTNKLELQKQENQAIMYNMHSQLTYAHEDCDYYQSEGFEMYHDENFTSHYNAPLPVFTMAPITATSAAMPDRAVSAPIYSQASSHHETTTRDVTTTSDQNRSLEETNSRESSPDTDPLTLTYFPPATASPYFEGNEENAISFKWENKTYGVFKTVDIATNSFKFKHRNQMLAYKIFFDQCSTTVQEHNQAQRDSLFYSWALPLFNNSLKDKTKIGALPGYPKLVSEGTVPNSQQFLRTLEKAKEDRLPIKTVIKDLGATDYNKTLRYLNSKAEHKKPPRNQPFTTLEFPNDKLVETLSSPIAAEHEYVSDITLGSSYFKVPSHETLAEHHVVKKDALQHLSQYTCLHVALSAIDVFRSSIVNKVSAEDLNYLESIQNWLLHTQQGESKSINELLTHLSKLHLKLRYEACGHQTNESWMNALLYKAPLASKYLLHSEGTKEVSELPQHQIKYLKASEQRTGQSRQPTAMSSNTYKPVISSQAASSSRVRDQNTNFDQSSLRYSQRQQPFHYSAPRYLSRGKPFTRGLGHLRGRAAFRGSRGISHQGSEQRDHSQRYKTKPQLYNARNPPSTTI